MSNVFAARRERIKARFRSFDACAMVITRPANVRYLTGFDSPTAALLITALDAAVLAVDAREASVAARICSDLEIVVGQRPAVTLVGVVGWMGMSRLAFEEHHVSVAQYEELMAAAGATRLVALGLAVEELREVKNDSEIVALRQAGTIADKAFDSFLGALKPGITERDIALLLCHRLADLGACAPPYGPYVASGTNSSIPHHRASDRVVEPGDLVTVNFGAVHEGYHSIIARTAVVGDSADWQHELYQAVADAHQAGCAAAQAGTAAAEVNRLIRHEIEAAGYVAHCPPDSGHGIGLEPREAPLIGPEEVSKLREQVTLTVEASAYLPDKGGVHLADTLVVRDGPPEILTRVGQKIQLVP
jgi:Xaa-Pro aminopeptidase